MSFNTKVNKLARPNRFFGKGLRRTANLQRKKAYSGFAGTDFSWSSGTGNWVKWGATAVGLLGGLWLAKKRGSEAWGTAAWVAGLGLAGNLAGMVAAKKFFPEPSAADIAAAAAVASSENAGDEDASTDEQDATDQVKEDE